MATPLEDIASQFELPNEGGLFVILGPTKCGKSSLITNNDLHLHPNDTIEEKVAEFLQEPYGLGRIVFDELSPRFYKSGFFKNLCNSCKQRKLQLFIISQNVRDLPPFVRSRVDYWFLFQLSNNYLGFPPLNALDDWTVPPHDTYTVVVSQFPENAKPDIWWYTKEKPRPKEIKKPAPVVTELVVPQRRHPDIDDNAVAELITTMGLLQATVKSNFSNLNRRVNLLEENLTRRIELLEKKLDDIIYGVKA